MSPFSFVRLFSALALTFGASTLSASTIAYAVGTCRLRLPSFSTITGALAAVPTANVVLVCPGTYQEQVQITHPVTLEGVSNGTSAQAIIAPPAGGLVINAIDDSGTPVAAQLWVNNASGPVGEGRVNISDLTVDGQAQGAAVGGWVVGIFYQNSAGTVNRVATRNQNGNLDGFGIYAQGGSSNPFVTIENSSIHDFSYIGIVLQTNTTSTELGTLVKGNEIALSDAATEGAGIWFGPGNSCTALSNIIVNLGQNTGIVTAPSDFCAIAHNTVVNGSTGISAWGDGISVTSNKIFGSATGIYIFESVGGIEYNSITNSAVGIEFNCFVVPNVQSNIITDAVTGIDSVPSATATKNTYFNVGTIRTGGC